MRLNWQQAATSTIIAGAVAAIVGWMLNQFISGDHVPSALAIGIAVGASRLIEWTGRR